MKNIVILSSSPRKNGNSDLLCQEFQKGALSKGHNVEYVRINDMNLGFCQGCYACNSTGKCFQQDGMNELCEKLVNADVIVFATPVYFYTMSAQLKTLIDRLVPVYTEIHSDIYMIITAWDEDINNLELTAESIRGCTRDCFENCTEKDVLIVGGVYEKGEVKNNKAMEKAFLLGANC
ncbi:MAG: flavodoxin family protein [Clostridia bacterium]|nr:flavodoxin family protein [Clostridia bacterium]